MGLLDKAKTRAKEPENLTVKEIEFILTKLRTAEYRGIEFEQYYNVVKKLADARDNSN